MQKDHLTQINHEKPYPLRLVIGTLFLTAPAILVILLFVLGGNLDFVWMPVLLGFLGWFLVIPSIYALPYPSREWTAMNALSMGFTMMMCLYSMVLPFRHEGAECIKDLISQGVRVKIQSSTSKNKKFKEENITQEQSKEEDL